MKQLKIISQKTVYKAPRFNVVETKLELNNKNKRLYRDIERCPSVYAFPMTPKGEVYLIYQYRYLVKKVVLGAVAGFIEKGETSIQTAQRELKEETGIMASQWEELLRIDVSQSVIKAQSYIFLAKDLEEGETSKEEGEEIELVKMSLLEAFNKIFSGEITDSGTIIGLFLLDKLRREKKL